ILNRLVFVVNLHDVLVLSPARHDVVYEHAVCAANLELAHRADTLDNLHTLARLPVVAEEGDLVAHVLQAVYSVAHRLRVGNSNSYISCLESLEPLRRADIHSLLAEPLQDFLFQAEEGIRYQDWRSRGFRNH